MVLCPSIRLSVAAVGLLLWAQQAGDIDRRLPGSQQQRRANVGSVMLSTYEKLNTDFLVMM